MRDTTPTCHAVLLACALAAAGPAFAAEASQPQSFKPDYFSQFQAGTAMDMVAHLPGFSFDGGNASRGAAGNVLINGKRPTSKSDALGDVLGRIPAAAVLHIDLINGGAGGIDMQGFASVANIVLKQMDLVSASSTASSVLMPDGSVRPALEGNYSLKHGDKSINLALGWSRSPDTGQGQSHRITQRAGSAPAEELAFAGAGIAENKTAKLNYGQDLLDGQISWNGAVRPWTYQSQTRYPTPVDGISRRDNNDNAGRTLEQGLAYARELPYGASMDLKALYRSADTAAVSTSVSMSTSGDTISRALSNSTASEQTVAGQLSWQALDGLVLRGGVERTVTTNDNSSSSSVNPAAAGAVAAPSPANVAWVQEARIEGQLSSAWQIDHAFNAEAGLKIAHSSLSMGAEHPEAPAHVYPKPRLRLSVAPLPSLLLRLRMERETSQLNFGDAAGYFGAADKALRAGYPDLLPSKTLLCEGALEYRFGDRGAATLSYTQSHISDVIDRMPIRTPSATFDAAGNIGDASADSVTGMLNLPTDSWSLPQGLLKLSTSWRSSSVTDPTTLETRRLSGEQPLAWRVEFSQDLPLQRTAWGFSVDNGWNNDSWQFAERDSSSGTGWARMFVNHKPAPNLTLTLELNNLAGRATTYDRTHYDGDRIAGGVDFVEHNITHTQPFAVLRVRRDW